ncbi:MAG: glycine betaine ABC transporter substrate-binding protein [Opitutales bacterium]|nr:glycine betaine ABC transporter substrate-binding protein [Opitutales bacterium]MCH8541035.1 glycine betaine ABC transporter substrate-binding protein [Opitutales bacterium]
MNKLTKYSTSVLLAGGLALGISACSPPTDEDPTIELGYVLWDSERASTHVVAAVLQDELGLDVSLTSVDAGPMWTGVAQGDFDAIVAAWLPGTHEEYMGRFEDQVVDLGPNLEGAKIGWVVPADAPVDTIPELNDHADLFGNRIVGIDPGSGLMGASERAMETYDLSDNFSLLDSSDAAMTTELATALGDGDMIVVTGWTPHWKFAAHDLKYLDDPENVFGDAEAIHTIVTPDLESKSPEAYNFLNNFNWTADQMAEVMILFTQEGMSEMEAARAWIAENREQVESWLQN